MNKNNKNEETEKTLALLEDAEDVSLNEHFETRLYAALKSEESGIRVSSGWLKPALAFAMILLLTANVITAFNYFENSNSSPASRELKVLKVAESYDVINYSSYNY